MDEKECIDALNYPEGLENLVIGEGKLEAMQEIVEKYRRIKLSI